MLNRSSRFVPPSLHRRAAAMKPNESRKLKALYIRKILEEETDPEHGLSMPQLIERLHEYGITAERKSIYRDFDALRSLGIDIKKYPRRPVEYAIDNRGFKLSELMLLIDAVESCKSLTKRQSAALTANLKQLASENQRQQLDRRIHVAGRIGTQNESVFGYIDVIHQAMREKLKIEFKYFRYGIDGKRHATQEGRPHVVTPVAVSYEDGFYYLTAWSDSHDSLGEYRIDRMGALRITDEKATRNSTIASYSFDEETHTSFGRFKGKPVSATLVAGADKIEIIFDRFGKDIEVYPKGKNMAKAVVKVLRSPQFFGWIAGLGGAVKIEGPKSLKQEYKDYLKSLLED